MEAPMIAAIQQETDIRPGMEPLWNTFDRNRARLYDQYLDVPYDPATGLSPSELEQVYFTETPNGSVLDLRLHPSSVAGPRGLNALIALVKIYLQCGVYALQFNVIDAETLRAAQRDPEAYATLRVRVAGYSAYFCNLTGDVQDHLIAQCTHAL